jgi:hypothetical protein
MIVYWIFHLFSVHAMKNVQASISGLNAFEIEFQHGLFIKRVVSVDSRIVVFMTTSEFHIYQLKNGQIIIPLNKIPHGYPGLDEDQDTPILCNRRMIIIVTKHILYYYKLSELDYSAEFMRAFPVQYFSSALTQFGSKIALSPSNSTLAIKTGTNEFHLVDLRDPIRLTARIFKPNIDKGNIEIYHFIFSDHGQSLTILYHDQSVYSVNIFTGKVMKYRFSVPLEDSILKYDSTSNNLVVLLTTKTNTKLHVLDGHMGDHLGAVDLEEIFSNHNLTLVETGTNYIGVQSIPNSNFDEPSVMVFVDIKNMKLYELAEVHLETQIYQTVDTTFEHSNLIMKVTNREPSMIYSFYSYTIPDEEFCHKTCSKNCEFSFVPCQQRSKTFLSQAIAFVIVFMLHWLTKGCWSFCNKKEKKAKPRVSDSPSLPEVAASLTEKSRLDTIDEDLPSMQLPEDAIINKSSMKDESEFPSDKPSAAYSASSLNTFQLPK